MENPIKMDDLGVPLFLETLIYPSKPNLRRCLGVYSHRSSAGGFLGCLGYTYSIGTPLKFNMEPENGPLEKEIPFGNHHFSGSMLNFRGVHGFDKGVF